MIQALRLESAPEQAQVTQSVLLPSVSWQTYQALLTDMGDHRVARLTYDQGWLHIKMPSQLHEIINRLLARIVTTLTEELDLEIVNYGSTTLDREDLAKGAEPDTCFYIQNAAQVQGLNPDIPPELAPDLVLEVDITSPSTRRLNVYLALGIPEVWCYTQKGGVEMLGLSTQTDTLIYKPLVASRVFPQITPQLLNDLLAQRQTTSENAIIKTFRAWIQQHSSVD
ncbi:MAG: Uma2 family endonuclease [Spirulina sp. SIO3F2]|nr:Uma2 family endonuclease [Spirulina sp. SIO3F2]